MNDKKEKSYLERLAEFGREALNSIRSAFGFFISWVSKLFLKKNNNSIVHMEKKESILPPPNKAEQTEKEPPSNYALVIKELEEKIGKPANKKSSEAINLNISYQDVEDALALAKRGEIKDLASHKVLSAQDSRSQIEEFITTEAKFCAEIAIVKQTLQKFPNKNQEINFYLDGLDTWINKSKTFLQKVLKEGGAIESFSKHATEYLADITFQEKVADIIKLQSKIDGYVRSLEGDSRNEFDGQLRDVWNLNFEAFNLKTVQRQSKYPLMLKDIIKKYPDENKFKKLNENILSFVDMTNSIKKDDDTVKEIDKNKIDVINQSLGILNAKIVESLNGDDPQKNQWLKSYFVKKEAIMKLALCTKSHSKSNVSKKDVLLQIALGERDGEKLAEKFIIEMNGNRKLYNLVKKDNSNDDIILKITHAYLKLKNVPDKMSKDSYVLHGLDYKDRLALHQHLSGEEINLEKKESYAEVNIENSDSETLNMTSEREKEGSSGVMQKMMTQIQNKKSEQSSVADSKKEPEQKESSEITKQMAEQIQNNKSEQRSAEGEVDRSPGESVKNLIERFGGGGSFRK